MSSSPFAGLGAEFANFAQYVVGPDANPTVTVEQVDPQSGEATLTAEGVTVLPLTSTGQPVKVGGGGLIGADECQFWLVAEQVGFVPSQNDRVIDAAGTRWNVTLCEVVGYGPTGKLYRCPATRARQDVTA